MALGILARSWWRVALTLLLATASAFSATDLQAQQQSTSSDQPANAKTKKKDDGKETDNSTSDADSDASSTSRPGFKGLAEDFLTDQKQIWTSPAKLRFSDTQWLIPLGGVSAAFFATDATASRHLSNAPITTSRYGTISNAGIAAMLGGPAGLWFLGHIKHNAHWTETGFLAGEAAVNSLVVVEAMKYSLGRQRPFQGDGNGSFFQGGTSFPSEHAAAAWSAAGVIAHEYPGPLPKIAAYGLAALIDFSRIRARQHFPSDVFVGSVIGNMVGQEIYSSRHDPQLGGDAWRSVSTIFRDINNSAPSTPASPFVPLDSWIYPAIERLSAQGLIDSTFLGSRPWTRIECARLVQEAGDHLAGTENSVAEQAYEQLYSEFASDLEALSNGSENKSKIESVYAGATQIVGKPINDSYHFGQTVINNFGQPYEQGFNSYDGFSAWAADGRFAIYVRGEFQHAPAAPGFSQPIQNLIASLDINPVQTAAPIASTDQFTLLDTYVSTTIGGWDFSFGKQSLWWGQGEGGALLFSDNAAPIYMFRASRTLPITLPWIFQHLGQIKIDAFIGKLSGNEFPARPILHGEALTLKPTKNLELSFSRLAEIGGAEIPGQPTVPTTTPGCDFGTQRALTVGAIVNSYLSFQESNFYDCNNSPGKRTAGFQFSYRLPFLRNWLTLYADSISPDDVSPISAPRRAAINPGIYISHFPKLPKLDLRIEGVTTDTPSSSTGGHFVYWDFYYHDLSTNENNLIGSWVGRNGEGVQAWSTYWFNGRSSLQFGYRHSRIASDFIPGGETFNDGSVQFSFWVHQNLDIIASTQYEQWLAPVLASTRQTNWTSSIGVTFHPRNWSLPFHSPRQTSDTGTLSEKGATP